MLNQFDADAVLAAPGVWNEDNVGPLVVLNSGLVTNVKVAMDKLVNSPDVLYPVMARVGNIADGLEADVFAPVPTGAVNLTEATRDQIQLPYIVTPRKVGKRVFDIVRPLDREAINEATNIVVFEDVVSTGGTPHSLAERVRVLNPKAALHLVAILRRSVLNPTYTDIFETQHFLIERDIPSWPSGTPQRRRI